MRRSARARTLRCRASQQPGRWGTLLRVPSTAQLLHFAVSGGMEKKASRVGVSSLPPNPDLLQTSLKTGFVLRFLPCGDTGFMIQHRA